MTIKDEDLLVPELREGDPLEELEKGQREALEKLLNAIRRQKDCWQQVPYWALMADGRTGWNSQFATAYRCGVWVIGATSYSGYSGAAVDCATGDVVCAVRWCHDGVVRPGHDLVARAMGKVLRREVDGAHVVDMLRKAAGVPYGSWYSEEDRRRAAEFRGQHLATMKLDPDYRWGMTSRDRALAWIDAEKDKPRSFD